MDSPLVKTAFEARAMLIGERLDLRSFPEAGRLAAAPLTVALPGGGLAVLFRYGAVVAFDAASRDIEAFLAQIRPLVAGRYAEPETERVEIRIDPDGREGMEGNTLCLKNAAVERMQIVADVLSKSVVLAFYEAKLARDFDRIEPLAVNLEQKNSSGRNARELLRHIGGALLSEHQMVGRVAVGEKPELLWESPNLERLYLRLEDEFELEERDAALERKLELISRTAHTVLELLQNRRSLRVEWYILILIVVEILLTLYEMFVRGH